MFALAKLGADVTSTPKTQPTLHHHQAAVAAQANAGPYPLANGVSLALLLLSTRFK